MNKNQLLAQAMLNILDQKGPKFNMSFYFMHNWLDIESCGTVACIAGHMAFIAGPTQDVRKMSESARQYRMMFEDDGREDNFIFSEDWPTDVEQATARVLIYLNGDYETIMRWLRVQDYNEDFEVPSDYRAQLESFAS